MAYNKHLWNNDNFFSEIKKEADEKITLTISFFENEIFEIETSYYEYEGSPEIKILKILEKATQFLTFDNK